MVIKIILVIFSIFALTRTLQRRQRGDISLGEAGGWVVLWLLVALAAIFPQSTDAIAQQLGVGRGADLLVYLAVVCVFYLLFRLLLRVEKMERDLSVVVGNEAQRTAQKPNDSK